METYLISSAGGQAAFKDMMYGAGVQPPMSGPGIILVEHGYGRLM